MIHILNKKIIIDGETHEVRGIDEFSIDRGYYWDDLLQRSVKDGMERVEVKWKSPKGVECYYDTEWLPAEDIVIGGNLFDA